MSDSDPLLSLYVPVLLQSRKSGITQPVSRLVDLVDPESASVRKPFEDEFGDSCWRSSWTYASLLVLYGLSQPDYEEFRSNEGLTIEHCRQFIRFFASNCASDNGFSVFGSPQLFTRDQLIPLMYFLTCSDEFDDDSDTVGAADSIVKNLREHESHARALSSDHDGTIGRNLGYLINRLCHTYGVNYKFKSRPLWLAAALPVAAANAAENIEIEAHNLQQELLPPALRDYWDYKETDNNKIADDRYELFLKQNFAAALSFNSATAVWEGSGDIVSIDLGDEEFTVSLNDLVDGYSVFNALAALSQLRVASGSVTDDLSSWRGKMKNASQLEWGPAFDIVSDRDTSSGVVDSLTWRVTDDYDNDVVQSQRPTKFMSGVFPARTVGGYKTLDMLILRALSVLWR